MADPDLGTLVKLEDKKEIILHGLPASGGIAIGPAYVFHREEIFAEERSLSEDEIDAELQLLEDAVVRADKELSKIARFAKETLNESVSEIFDGQLLILHDVELKKTLVRRIRLERKSADFLIKDEFEKYKSLLITSGVQSFRERSADLDEVAQRLLRCLKSKRLHSTIEGQHIVVARMLTPADTILFSKNDVLGYIDEQGGITSHTAILARSLKIPAAVGVHGVSDLVQTGDLIILDGINGVMIYNPQTSTLMQYEQKLSELERLEDRLKDLIDLPCVTPDGHKVELAANAEFFNEVDFLLAQGAGGIGLYRTEHLYMSKGDFPSEQEQFVAYSKIAHMIYPRMVIIRTFDVGGDKILAPESKEKNPFLGWRGIRMLLDRPQVFKQQLRAILRASVMKNVRLMFPMISGVLELRRALALLEEAKNEILHDGIDFDQNMEVGIMIEVPSAVIIADELAREVDFFSIGTNDLIQYLLAIDRGNDLISDLYQEFHPSVVRSIRTVIEAGHDQGIWVGMCGEMAGNPLAAPLLLGLGLDEFSVVPSVIPEIKSIIRRVRYEEACLLAKDVGCMSTTREIKQRLEAFARQYYPELMMTSFEV